MIDVILESIKGFPVTVLIEVSCALLLLAQNIYGLYSKKNMHCIIKLNIYLLLISLGTASVGIYSCLIKLLNDFVWSLPESSLKFSSWPMFSYYDFVLILFPLYLFFINVIICGVFCFAITTLKIKNHEPLRRESPIT